MALNWVTIVHDSPLLFPGESSIEAVDGVKYNLTIPVAPSPSGASGGLKKLEAVGTMTLTDQRVCIGWIYHDEHSYRKAAHMD